MTHILRHTFASHFMMNGGDILTLQKILGHSDLKMTLRYAHLSPDYLNQALEFNPLANLLLPQRVAVCNILDGLKF
ncbi:MAG: tyrosine-type recombinase/integrase [Saccharospirillaceae bacterium]|nr:tyrosine-type recombinase/integrase [Saccharospirillaceae bacterium]